MATPVTDGVVQQRLAHSKVIYLRENSLLLDTGPDSTWNNLVDFIEAEGAPETVFLSHSHGDHVGNIERLLQEYHPEVLVPENESFGNVDFGNADMIKVSDGDEVTEGVTVIEVPGHTEGICALYAPDANLLLVLLPRFNRNE